MFRVSRVTGDRGLLIPVTQTPKRIVSNVEKASIVLGCLYSRLHYYMRADEQTTSTGQSFLTSPFRPVHVVTGIPDATKSTVPK